MDILIDNLLAFSHSVNLSNSEFNEVIIEFTCVFSIRIVVSSANGIVNHFSETPAKSLIYKTNNKGPNMDLWGTSCVIDFATDETYILFSIFQIAFKPIPSCTSNIIFVMFV